MREVRRGGGDRGGEERRRRRDRRWRRLSKREVRQNEREVAVKQGIEQERGGEVEGGR